MHMEKANAQLKNNSPFLILIKISFSIQTITNYVFKNQSPFAVFSGYYIINNNTLSNKKYINEIM